MDDNTPSFEDMMSMLAMVGTQLSGVTDMQKEYLEVCSALEGYDPVRTASTFGALLTLPDLQCNGARLEALAHAALALGANARKPNAKLVNSAFNALGKGSFGRAEDPAEDVFVGLIRSSRGQFLVLEGVWESSSFFLQRIVNVIERMPEGSGYDELRDSVYALLTLSDLVCKRAGLKRYEPGGEMPAERLSRDVLFNLPALLSRVEFTKAQLEEVGVTSKNLFPFVFDPDDRSAMQAEPFGHSNLERHPVVWEGDQTYLVLPSTVSVAIRRLVFECMDGAGMRDHFVSGLAREYQELFAKTRLLGGPLAREVEFLRTDNGFLAALANRIDRGRYLNVVFVMDDLSGFEADSFAGSNPDPTALADDIDKFIQPSYEQAIQQADYREGMTLIVGCGIGRQSTFAINNVERKNWRIETVSAADLCTLGEVSKFKPLTLWRIFDAQDELERQGVVLQNINGLLNLVGWIDQLDGHLVPHGQLPDGFSQPGSRNMIIVDQNALRALRHRVKTTVDAHVQPYIDGRLVDVRREGKSHFEEDNDRPSYICEDWIAGVYLTDKRSWWAEVEDVENTSPRMGYEQWRTVNLWLSRAAPVLEAAFPALPDGPILWKARFASNLHEVNGDTAPAMDFAAARAELTHEVAGSTLTVRATEAFENAHLNAENIAERALVAAFIDATAEYAGRELLEEEREALLEQIIPSPMARQQHAFRRADFRDLVRGSLPERVVTIERMDDAAARLGMGWKARGRGEAPWIEGVENCTTYLNKLVGTLTDELITDLRKLDRRSLIHMALQNHEIAAVDRDRWYRTMGSVLALHNDQGATMTYVAERDAKLTAVAQSTRSLVEFAICECPIDGGRRPGQLDLARLMSQAALLFHVGGWSDAIRWGVMEPKLRITPLGDVHANFGYIEDVVEPFGRASTDDRLLDAVQGYSKHVAKRELTPSVAGAFDQKFLAAFEDETGVSLDQMRLFIDYVEDLGYRLNKAVVEVPYSKLLEVNTDGGVLDPAIARLVIDFLAFSPRASWKDTPEGYDAKDRHPWRFRRRLSVVRKPLIRWSEGSDPLFMFAPSMVRDAFIYTVSNYHRGDFPDRQLKPLMRAWAGHIADKRGSNFARAVAEKLEAAGWKTSLEVRVTKLLKKGFERDYGDVDVLAWNSDGRVLIIECKDVQFRKTYGEVAEQIADFRGTLRSNGKRDYLRLHLDRVDLIAAHLPAIAGFIGADVVSKVESHLVFRNPVPMTFALAQMREQVSVHLFDDLAKI